MKTNGRGGRGDSGGGLRSEQRAADTRQPSADTAHQWVTTHDTPQSKSPPRRHIKPYENTIDMCRIAKTMRMWVVALRPPRRGGAAAVGVVAQKYRRVKSPQNGVCRSHRRQHEPWSGHSRG